MTKIFKKIIPAVVVGILVLSGAFSVRAETVNCPDGKYCALTTLVPGIIDAKQPVDPVNVVKNIYGISIGIAAILAVIMIIWAGIEYATVESIQGHSNAKEKWQGAIWGLVLLLGSYLILKTVNLQLVNVNLDLGKPLVGSTIASSSIMSRFLSDAEAISRNAQEQVRAAEMAAQTSQTSLQELKDKKALLEAQIASEHDAQKIASLRQQITDISEAITAKETEVTTLQNTLRVQQLNSLQATVSNQSLDAIRNGGSIQAIKQAVATGAANLAALRASGLASEADIQKASDELKAANVIALSAQSAVDLSNSVRNITEQSIIRRGGYVIPPAVLAERNRILNSTNSRIDEIQRTSPDVARSLITQTSAQIGVLDQVIATKAGCPHPQNGIDHVSGTSFQCVN